MPLYSYKCFYCGHEFELSKPVKERYEPTYDNCPKCKAVCSVQKILDPIDFKIHGASAKNGYSTDVGDVEKFMGRELTNEDLD